MTANTDFAALALTAKTERERNRWAREINVSQCTDLQARYLCCFETLSRSEQDELLDDILGAGIAALQEGEKG